jgi:hypothetical protein
MEFTGETDRDEDIGARPLDGEDSGIEDDDARFSDWESDHDEEYNLKSLFAVQTFTNIRDALDFDEKMFNFDLVRVAVDTLGSNIDEIGLIKLVNYIRDGVRKASEANSALASEDCATSVLAGIKAMEFLDDIYMRPSLPDDDLLFLLPEYMQELGHAALFDAEELEAAAVEEEATGGLAASSSSSNDSSSSVSKLAATAGAHDAPGAGGEGEASASTMPDLESSEERA